MSQISHALVAAMRQFAGCFALWALCQSGVAQAAETLRLSSGSVQTPLLELYTSEGCSSCPPADRFFQTLADSDGLWKRYVPVAFHVTYWDYLGWRDRFSQQAFDDRQRRLARRANSGVYTPGVFLQGQEWRSWRRTGSARQQLQNADRPLVGVLQATVSCGGGTITFNADPDANVQASHAELAWLQSAQQTDVRSGENRGRTLHHDFVVAAHRRVALVRSTDNGFLRASIVSRCDADAQPQAIAVWVTDDEGRPLQAVGGYLNNPVAAGSSGSTTGH